MTSLPFFDMADQVDNDDVVCILEVTTRDGARHEVPLSRKADPVAALDKFLANSRISLTDISALHCRAHVSAAITSRACSAVTATLEALI